MAKYAKTVINMNPAQAKAAAARAKQLGLSLEEFIVYATIRYLDDRTPLLDDSKEWL